ncbi:MAG: UDP-glucose 4-epimerase GalE [Patescibacteria group bacterium]|nr:UDP-glucose 4-epimerase GalE [Patescibacteria group bacterium]
MKVLITGGCGYIGAHTTVDLVNEGFDVISIDDNSRSNEEILKGVAKITGKEIKNYRVNLCDSGRTREVFEQNRDLSAVIHFAAYKTVPESVENPLLYYRNNIDSLLSVLDCLVEFKIPYFVFSSSCAVYGNIDTLPVTEESPLKEAECPYARTKQIGEKIIFDLSKVSSTKSVMLRYFNPVGAHESGLIGEVPYGKPENLVPVITQTAIGKIKELTIYGKDYSTRDGTCIRDYIHVMDIANAHTKAVQYLVDSKNGSNYEIFNLGSGTGVTVLEAVKAFEGSTGVKLNYTFGPRRPGDVVAIYADNKKAIEKLKWDPQRDINEMMSSAWKWELNLEKKEG